MSDTAVTALRLPSDAIEIELGMSNCMGEIDDGFADALMAQPGKVFGRHAGWEFNAKVWFTGAEFASEVWRYRCYMETITAPTLPDLMKATNEKWGYE